MSTTEPSRQRETLATLLRALRREFAVVAALAGAVNLLMLAPTLYMLQVFDRVMLSGNLDTLLALTMLTVALVGLMAVCDWLRARVLVQASTRLDRRLALRAFEAALASRGGRPEQTVVQALQDVTQLRQFATGSGALAIVDAPWSLVFLAALTLMHPLLGLTGAVLTVLLLLLAWGGWRWTAAAQAEATASAAAAQGFLRARLPAADTVLALGLLAPLRAQWQALHRAGVGQGAQALRATHQVQAVVRAAQYAQQALVLSAGAWLAMRGELTVGAVVAASALLNSALRPVNLLVGAWRGFVDARDAHARLQALLQVAGPLPPATAGANPVPGALEVHHLTARVGPSATAVLHGISLRFEPGQITAIAGPSGAGKSTLAQCLVGIWDDCDGEVRIGGIPRTVLDLEALGRRTGYLPQDGQLFAGTVAENIARLGPVDDVAVVEAAMRSQAHAMILALPNGYDTPLSGAGANLSGGQRQRLALARALYGQPQLVVLDEPSNHLDDAGERALLAALQHLRDSGAVVVLVTHHRQLLARADRVIELRDGRVLRSHVPQSEEASA